VGFKPAPLNLQSFLLNDAVIHGMTKQVKQFSSMIRLSDRFEKSFPKDAGPNRPVRRNDVQCARSSCDLAAKGNSTRTQQYFDRYLHGESSLVTLLKVKALPVGHLIFLAGHATASTLLPIRIVYGG
jgi:hypothetical protein